jgi:hypothetical protein
MIPKGFSMRKIAAGLVLGILLFAIGCRWLPWRQDQQRLPVAAGPATVPALVRDLNANARLVQAVEADLDLDCKAQDRSVGLSGHMVCQKPHNFRLKAKVMGKDAVDLGSNDKEFWYWISQAEPPYVYHCSYEDLARGVQVPFPFQPDMVVAALGMKQYDEERPEKKYVLKKQGRFLQLFEPTRGPRGEQLFRVTVFDNNTIDAGKRRVVAYMLVDRRGQTISKATVHDVMTTREGAVVPTRMTLVWPAEKIELKLKLYHPKLEVVSAARADKLFQWTDLTRDGGLHSHDLALGPPPLMRASSHRQATYLTPRR